MDYLFDQSGITLFPDDVDLEIDEGFEEMEDSVNSQPTDDIQDPTTTN